MLKLSCLCGQVRIEIPKRPDFINECNCTLCSKSGARWAYFHPSEVIVVGTTKGYSREDKDDDFQLSLEPPPLPHRALAAMNQAPQQVVWNIPQSFDRLMQYCPYSLQPAIHLSLSGQLGRRHLPVRSMDIWHHLLELTYCAPPDLPDAFEQRDRGILFRLVGK